MPLNLPKRPGGLGKNMSLKPNIVQENVGTRFAIPIATTLTPEEWGEVILNERAPKTFWKKIRSRESQLMYPQLGVQTLSTPIRFCTVSLWLHEKIMKLTDCTLTANRFTLGAAQVGWTFQIQALPTINDILKELFTSWSQPILFALECETWGTVQQLPLEEEEEEPKEPKTGELLPSDSDEPSSIQEQIEATEAKKKKQRGRKKKS